jgi:hypothetical protein
MNSVALTQLDMCLCLLQFEKLYKVFGFCLFLCPLFNTASSAAPQIPLCRRIELSTVATWTLAARRTYHLAKSHQQV